MPSLDDCDNPPFGHFYLGFSSLLSDPTFTSCTAENVFPCFHPEESRACKSWFRLSQPLLLHRAPSVITQQHNTMDAQETTTGLSPAHEVSCIESIISLSCISPAKERYHLTCDNSVPRNPQTSLHSPPFHPPLPLPSHLAPTTQLPSKTNLVSSGPVSRQFAQNYTV